jgi:hypothetical protein
MVDPSDEYAAGTSRGLIMTTDRSANRFDRSGVTMIGLRLLERTTSLTAIQTSNASGGPRAVV